jgi:hypothetical protein
MLGQQCALVPSGGGEWCLPAQRSSCAVTNTQAKACKAINTNKASNTNPNPNPKPAPKLNVLHIVADDLRPELGLYNSPNAITPNLDTLAAKSSLYQRLLPATCVLAKPKLLHDIPKTR